MQDDNIELSPELSAREYTRRQALRKKAKAPHSVNITFSDEYEGDFSTRRVLMYTMTFNAKTYLFGPIAESTDGIIRKVQVDYYTNTDKQNAKREMRYTATPDPVNAEPDDDFGFSENSTMFFDGKQYSPTRREDV